MPESLPDIIRLSRAQRYLVWQRVFGARLLLVLIGVGCIWLLYALEWFGIDLFGHGNDEEGEASSNLVVYAALTLALVIYGAWDARRGLNLSRRGVLVRARVSSISALNSGGCVPLRYSYAFQGKSYGGACDIGQDQAAELSPGQPFWLLVDRANPRNSDYVPALSLQDHDQDEG